MPAISPSLLVWARETSGLTPEEAARRLGLKPARGKSATERLEALETGAEVPTRPMLLRIAKQYHRPLLSFYLSAPPSKGDRGTDFRTLPAEYSTSENALLDVLIREVSARQSMVRAVLEEEDEATPIRFIGSMQMSAGVPAVVASLRRAMQIDLTRLRAEVSPDASFSLLRGHAEALGIFVLLVGNLGSHHSAISVEIFRGFALADPVAPFVVINDQDAKSAWSFSLLHEMAHLWLGQTGVSGARADSVVEQFCNDVAGEFLLPSVELSELRVSDATPRAKLTAVVVRRHRVGAALTRLVGRMLGSGALTTTKAGKILGVKPQGVQTLLGEAGLPAQERAA